MRAPAIAVVAAPLLAAALTGCGPYTDVGQKLDVGATILAGDTWIAATATEARLLVLGKPEQEGERAAFAFTSIALPISAGTSVRALQGTYHESRADGWLRLEETLEYRLADESAAALLSRHGSTRDDIDRMVTFTQSRAGGRLALGGGDPGVAASYVPLPDALARLGAGTPFGPDTPSGAACAFQLANLAVRSSQVRILGFGGPSMTQYSVAAFFKGTLAGDVRVYFNGSGADITYRDFADFAGVRIAGTQSTNVDWSGNGHMYGTVAVTLEPAPLAGGATPPITGTIGYGDRNGGGDSIQIHDGLASGGRYVVALDAGGAARVDPVAPPSPSVADCLGLP